MREEDRELMQQMVRDHANGLAFVAEIMELATSASDEELSDALKRVQEFNANELEPHLQHEEQTILGPLLRNHPEHRELCITIGKEHGYIRTLLEEMHPDSARADLTEFGRTLESHTILEDEVLFPLVETLFNKEQKRAIADFIPLGHRTEVQHATIQPVTSESSTEYTDCLAEVKRFFSNTGKHDGSIVLLPRYDPDVSAWLADQVGSDLFNYQAEVMTEFGGEAASITLEQLTESLRSRAEKSSIVSHNVEALLCTKPEHERRDWLQSFLDTDWPNTILLPITIYQAEVPTGHAKVCDLELYKFSWLNRCMDNQDQVASN
ncbi:MAG: hemerythrin domain-containing protein [Sedimenticola sp.]